MAEYMTKPFQSALLDGPGDAGIEFKNSTDVRRLDRATWAENGSGASDLKAVQFFNIRCLEWPRFTAIQ